MELRLGQIETTIGTLLGDRRGVRSRLQYLSNADFPPGLRVTKARNATYRLEELWALSLWFSLARLAVAPVTAIALITEFWPEAARALIAAHRGRDSAPDAARLRFVGDALATSRSADGDARAAAATFHLVRDNAETNAASLTVDAAALLADLRLALEGVVGDDVLNDALDSLRARTKFEPTRHNLEMGDRPPTPPEGLRIDEQDFFIPRAVETIDLITPKRAIDLSSHRHLPTLVAYLMRPMRREAWLQVVEIRGTGLPFRRGLDLLLSWASFDRPGSEQDPITAASDSEAIGLGNPEAFAEAMVATMRTAARRTPIDSQDASSMPRQSKQST